MVGEIFPDAARPSALASEAIFELKVTGAEDLAVMTGAVDDLCTRIERHAEEAVAIIRLGGRASFSWPGAISVQDANRWERAMLRLERVSAILVTAAQGPCGGPSLDFLLASDFRIGSTDLAVQFPVNEGQFWPGMCIYRLVHQVGIARARQMVLWGRNLTAVECRDIGLVDEISDDLEVALGQIVPLAGRQPGGEVAIRRRLLLEAISSPFEDALGAHLAACDRELRRIRQEAIAAVSLSERAE
jgi:isomerase DpgB